MTSGKRLKTPISACLAAIVLAAFAPVPQPAPVPAITPGLAVPPIGWAYLPELAVFGPADIFRIVSASRGDHGPNQQMRVHTEKNVGILTRDVDIPLTDAATLKWHWKVDQIPSKLPETTAAHHDYFSIAVKFENGRDITYMWSSSLAKGVGFDCPLPGWTGREYHVVVRSGTQDLGKWLGESRNVTADYAKYVGGKPPGRIVQVWLIANTIIQQGEANASFGNIVIAPGPAEKPLIIF